MGTRDIYGQDTTSHAGLAWPMPASDPLCDTYASATPAAQRRLIAELVGQLYEDGSPTVRTRMLEKLLRPMGVFALIHIANGIFAQIKMGNAEWQGFQIRAQDIRRVTADQVIALVEQVQLVGDDIVRGLSYIVATSPALAQTAAARSLLQLLGTQREGRSPAISSPSLRNMDA